jgi:hypothetical protein
MDRFSVAKVRPLGWLLLEVVVVVGLAVVVVVVGLVATLSPLFLVTKPVKLAKGFFFGAGSSATGAGSVVFFLLGLKMVLLAISLLEARLKLPIDEDGLSSSSKPSRVI